MDEKMKSLPYGQLTSLAGKRQHMIDAADGVLPSWQSSANLLAADMHPAVQRLKVAEIKPRGSCISYTLVPADSEGRCAPFAAGQYLSVRLRIGSMDLTRPYSICSTPREAIDGKYVITVEYVPGGMASVYIHDTWKVGTLVETSAPLGTFGYEPLRDAAHVIALAGGSGVTPFLSMAGAICDGTEDFDLTILYGNPTMADAVFADDLSQLEKSSNGKVHVIHVLESETLPGCECGFITADLVRKYMPEHDLCSVFLCGPRPMYIAMEHELPKLQLEKKQIRRELLGETLDPHTLADCPALPKHTVHVTARIQGTEYSLNADPEISLLRSLEKAGIHIPSHCRSGECGCCRAHLISGQTWTPFLHDGRRMADKAYGWVHLCSTWPIEDVVIEI